jgi:citrate/tricarballylate utilization protein
MAVCNACRYCEGYCPVFPAMENRTAFAKGDLSYLANLCHNCGECLYACQFAPPHEFGIDVPRTLAKIRLGSYEEFCWPAAFAGRFRRQRVSGALVLSLVSSLVIFALAVIGGAATRPVRAAGDFYGVIPHGAMVGLFGAAGLFVLLALSIGCLRAARAFATSAPAGATDRSWSLRGLMDALTLEHLHGSGADCTDAEEHRSPWRRRFHHLTFYGFMLCFASTTVAAVYHVVFGWRAPYAYGSLPVVLGTLGGAGLLAGPAGLMALRRRRDTEMLDPDQNGLDYSFMVMLLMTSVTGLLLLALRNFRAMPALLVVHLGFVLGLFLTMPYGKFVHGFYRTIALLKFAAEDRR